ncbi:lysine N6-hydroxylase [Pseudomonas sp. GGS8]|uniref:lysine N(6)-hydroxylase/L-ornithine N(5)-oxygenase family protein n=1 Tax=Pseudomonas sp. GGS8 TaxID=2817892 RepID=UPI00209DE97E|nr:SidA/IucD/PvdA family monooxygenase [Pseudomonas sp. GGS8]MCP1446494.1 lysine N6-hydroxylase [Pseudomonas sp. GGS8]
MDVVNMEMEHYHLVGIGAGPANLSLAALLHNNEKAPNLFIDQKQQFSWHDEQMLDGATLQVSIFKDLASLSDPTNRFTFLSYLHDQGRIYHFLNAQFAQVPRREFRNYLAWAAEKNENVIFGEKVLHINFNDVFIIKTNKRTITANNIAIGVGTQPWVPEFAKPHLGKENFHICEYLQKSSNLAGKRVAVVGGGQSGAEVFLDLLSRPFHERPSQICWISRRRNFSPIDDSTFTNDTFIPDYSNYFNQLPPSVRNKTIKENILTSDGISEHTLRAIYQKIYYSRFVDNDGRAIGLYPNRNVLDITPSKDIAGEWKLTLIHNDFPEQLETLEIDAVVWATGFSPASKDFLAPLKERLRSEGGEYVVDDDFAVQWDGPANRNIFMQNGVRGQRGLPDVNLSLNAWRAQRIVGRLLDKAQPKEQLSSFITWKGLKPDEVTESTVSSLIGFDTLKVMSNGR